MDFLRDLERRLDLPAAEKEQVLREMEAHYHEVVDECLAAGMDEEGAAREAVRRMGDPGHLAARLQTVHGRATWRSAILAAVPVVVISLARMGTQLWGMMLPEPKSLPQAGPLLLGAMISAVLLAVSVREVQAGRRPVWVATWLAGGLAAFPAVVLGAHAPHSGWQVYPWSWRAAVVGAVAIWTFWDRPAWRATVALLAVCCALPSAGSGVRWGLTTLLQTGIAVRLFARHPHGNLFQASLFLFVPAIYWPNPVHCLAWGHGLEWYLGSWAGVMLAAVMIILTASRGTTQLGKIAVLASGATLTSLATTVAQNTVRNAELPGVPMLVLFGVLQSVLSVTVLVLAPWLLVTAAQRIRRA